ncbi:hypothetical protein [Novosphingobium sp. RL4]|uniref:hypothetical protein n=1 Tax=Novosphingobium sp. RL4 TaxID=3109595 RepID=UPI002D783BD2|nr:hypothetical protein [Novosphingobium sp. RL4]WRT91939.1 hypothetical protein U9J33_12030 [Novosphingobium sp. RL4]
MTDIQKSTPEDLRREITRLLGSKGHFAGADYRAFTPAPPDTRLRESGRTLPPAERGAFGRWLLRQTEATGLLANLVKAARADRQFPLDGDPEAVRKRLRDCGADGDMFEAVEETELDWLSY